MCGALQHDSYLGSATATTLPAYAASQAVFGLSLSGPAAVHCLQKTSVLLMNQYVDTIVDDI
jgi:hypothetical protein